MMRDASNVRGSSSFAVCEVCGANVRVKNLGHHRSRVHPAATFRTPMPKAPRPRMRPVRARLRAVVLIVAVLLVASTAALLFVREAERGRPIESDAIRMTISMSGFSPDTLSVQTGSVVRVDLVNLDNPYHSDGGGNHNFVMPDLGISVLVPPESQRVFSVASSTPGTYAWYCDICCGGKDNPLMVGTLTVTG